MATVGRVSLSSFPSASMSTASTTVLLDIAGAWDKISFSNGACYLRTVTNSTSMIKMPNVQSGRGICTSPGVSTELVEGEWGKAPNLFFSPMFSFAPSVKTFPVTVSLPPRNLGGTFLVSVDSAKVLADLTSFSLTAAGASANNPVLPASVQCGAARAASVASPRWAFPPPCPSLACSPCPRARSTIAGPCPCATTPWPSMPCPPSRAGGTAGRMA